MQLDARRDDHLARLVHAQLAVLAEEGDEPLLRLEEALRRLGQPALGCLLRDGERLRGGGARVGGHVSAGWRLRAHAEERGRRTEFAVQTEFPSFCRCQ